MSQVLAGRSGRRKELCILSPTRKLNLKAQNIMNFIRIAEGIVSETWTYHLRKNAYSKWFNNIIKDEDLPMKFKGLRITKIYPLRKAENGSSKK